MVDNNEKGHLDAGKCLLEFIKCVVCYDHIVPPAHGCKVGHFTCEECRKKGIKTCPTCKGNIQELEVITRLLNQDSFELPCKFAADGCSKNLVPSELPRHVQKCHKRCVNRNLNNQ